MRPSIPETIWRRFSFNGVIEARSPMGIATDYVHGHPDAEASQRVVSFSEPPIDEAWLCLPLPSESAQDHVEHGGVNQAEHKTRKEKCEMHLRKEIG